MWRVLFGLRGVWIGWVFPVAGMAVALGAQINRTTYRESTTGTILAVEDTGRVDDGDTVYRVSFDLADRAGIHHQGSFETKHHVEPGPQELEYQPERPSDAQLPGGRWLTTTLGLLFAGTGLLAVLASLAKGRAALRLLRYGEPTTGKLVSKEDGGDGPDRLTFEYEARGKVRRIVIHGSDPRIEDDEREPMLFDVKNPDHAVTIDDLPGKPTIREDGSLASKPGLGVHVLVLPAVFAVLTVWWVMLLVRS